MRARGAVCLALLVAACAPRRAPDGPHERRALLDACRREDDAEACGLYGLTRADDKDPRSAAAFYRRACDGGWLPACSSLAKVFVNGSAGETNPKRGFELAQKACPTGKEPACGLLGFYLFHGKGTPADPARAFPLLERGCTAETSFVCRALGEAYLDGKGVTANRERALAAWRTGCPSDDFCCWRIGQTLWKDDIQGAGAAYRAGCDRGGDQSCHALGDWYRRRMKDPVEAARPLRYNCSFRNVGSCTYLGRMLLEMNPPQVKEGEFFLTEMCEEGLKRACHDLAVWRLKTEGRSERWLTEIAGLCDKDEPEACRWLCEDAGKDLASATCQRACRLGEGDLCGAPDGGAAPK